MRNGYLRSYDILQNDDYQIVLIENYPCNSKNELERRERYWIENTDCVNKNIPTRSKKEADKAYALKNADRCKQYKDQYYQKNKQTISEKGKQPFECICGVSITNSSRLNHLKSKKHQKWEQTQVKSNEPKK